LRCQTIRCQNYTQNLHYSRLLKIPRWSGKIPNPKLTPNSQDTGYWEKSQAVGLGALVDGLHSRPTRSLLCIVRFDPSSGRNGKRAKRPVILFYGVARNVCGRGGKGDSIRQSRHTHVCKNIVSTETRTESRVSAENYQSYQSFLWTA